MLSEKPLIERLDNVKEGLTVLQRLLKGDKTQLIKSSNILLNPHIKKELPQTYTARSKQAVTLAITDSFFYIYILLKLYCQKQQYEYDKRITQLTKDILKKLQALQIEPDNHPEVNKEAIIHFNQLRKNMGDQIEDSLKNRSQSTKEINYTCQFITTKNEQNIELPADKMTQTIVKISGESS